MALTHIICGQTGQFSLQLRCSHHKKCLISEQNIMKVTNWSLKCGYLLVFGLCLYLLDIGLHFGLAVKYLTMQGCHRSVSHTFTNFKLDDLVDLENLTENLSSKGMADSCLLYFSYTKNAVPAN